MELSDEDRISAERVIAALLDSMNAFHETMLDHRIAPLPWEKRTAFDRLVCEFYVKCALWKGEKQ